MVAAFIYSNYYRNKLYTF